MSSRPGSVLLGFVVFLAFTCYDQSRSGAETEALMVVQQVETAQLFPEEVAGVVDRRAHLLRAAPWYGTSGSACAPPTLGDRVNPWGVELFRTVESVEPETTSE